MTNSYPAITGNTVTEAHARKCREEGHATHTVDGIDSGACPRCGEVATPTGLVETFDLMLSLEAQARDEMVLERVGADTDTRHRGATNRRRITDRIMAIAADLTAAELAEFRTYRQDVRRDA